MTKKKIEAEINIIDIEFPNKGIGLFENKPIYIKNTLPGQKVLARISKKKGVYNGQLLKILDNASYEIQPKCNVFGKCGGCTYQNISYEKELLIKKNNVLKLLENGDITGFEFHGIQGSPDVCEYRNKMEFSFGDSGNYEDLCLGMRKRNSYYEVVNAFDCNIVDNDFNIILKETLNFFRENKESFYHRIKKTGTLRHLLVRRAVFTKEILVAIVTTSNMTIDLTPLKNKLISLNLKGKIKGILQIINDSVADVIIADETKLLYGQDFLIEELLGLKFKISLFSFFQTNSKGAEVLYKTIKDFVGNKTHNVIFDLYCGTGTIAQLLSENCENVFGIELVEEAIDSAKINAKLNNISNCEFIVGDVLKTIDNLEIKPDLIVLDPPREGINSKAIPKIVKFGAKEIIYVSCKASSMIKDLNLFKEMGYEIKKIKFVDMFPRTYHVESVCLLQRIER